MFSIFSGAVCFQVLQFNPSHSGVLYLGHEAEDLQQLNNNTKTVSFLENCSLRMALSVGIAIVRFFSMAQR